MKIIKKKKNISKSYIKGDKIIDNLNLEVKNGEILGFIGPNGAGKTTVIKMMTGILEIDAGDILIDGKSIQNEPYEAKKHIGFTPDNPDMFLNLKGIEYLNFIADIYQVGEEREDIIRELAQKFEIETALHEKIESYSHGMRQKIVIIGVLLHNPKNWILDEPITGLDPKAIYDLKIMMKEHAKKGNVVFFSTHILEVAENLCDRVAIIHKGKILFLGTIGELKNKMKENTSLEEIFMEIIKND